MWIEGRMAEGTEDRAPGAASMVGADTAAVAAALGGASRAEANAFLKKQGALSDKQSALADKQGRFLDLQVEDLQRKHAVPFRPAASWPWLAYTNAGLGDFGAARALIDRTPGDYYLCVRMWGNIDAAEKKRTAAARWFDDATRPAPSIPFAYADRGTMLTAKGDDDDAIAKFTIANAKGPQFADPLEMWDEALIRQNRSDLALANFEEADKYTPNWGCLRLKWGEALLWSGDKAGAAKQFHIASGLDLTASEESELARLRGMHD
jgi:predicted Zn-dependent protease